MKTINTKKSRKQIYWSVAVLLLIAALVFVYYLLVIRPATQNKTTPGDAVINLEKPTDAQIKAGEDTKKATIENDKQAQQSSSQDTITVTLNAQQNGNQVVFDTFIKDILGQGECTLTVTSGAATVTKTADVFANPSSSSCRGFSMFASDLPSGMWKATLSISSNDRTGETTITLEVQ